MQAPPQRSVSAMKVRASNTLHDVNVEVQGLLRQRTFMVLWLTPFVIFLFLSLLYIYAFMQAPTAAIIFSIIFGLVSLILLGFGGKHPTLIPLSLLVMLSMIGATAFGLYVYDTYTVFPRFYANSRIYTNVVPSQPSAAVSDAGKLVFTGESFVDTKRSVSYVTEDGWTYCVAPVRDGSGSKRVEFWAAGMGCCSHEGDSHDFFCDSVGEKGAHSGAVVFDNAGYFFNARLDYYDKARKKAESSFGLLSANVPMYVRWVSQDNLDSVSNTYRNEGIVVQLPVYFFCLIALFGLAYVCKESTAKLLVVDRSLSASAAQETPPP